MMTWSPPLAFYIAAIGFLGGLTIRSALTRCPHSGQSKPPMFGDYEAQRHWMEITHQLPVKKWYRHSNDNDLQYWGLDYPPLTAYHSLLMGHAAWHINKSWVALNESRGEESPAHKVFMRRTVLFADVLTFLPACLLFVFWGLNGKEAASRRLDLVCAFALCCLVTHPGLVIIDHGHFQYNGVSLGLAIASVACFMRNQDIIGAVLFCCSLLYKQMLLYYSLPIFFYLLAKCLYLPLTKGVLKLAGLAVTVVLTFVVIFSPFLGSWDDFLAVLIRLFPFNRGLFEDKVANVWCSLSPIVKLKNLFTPEQLVALCSSSTLLLHAPCAWALLTRRPSARTLRYALAVSSLTFFLFSYQVHEKSILIPAIAVAMLADEMPKLALHFTFISTMSMWPLLTKDDLLIPTGALCILQLALGALLCPVQRVSANERSLYALSVSGYLTLVASSLLVIAPDRFPDIHAVAISGYSCLQFLLYLVHFNCVLLFDLNMDSRRVQPKKQKRK